MSLNFEDPIGNMYFMPWVEGSKVTTLLLLCRKTPLQECMTWDGRSVFGEPRKVYAGYMPCSLLQLVQNRALRSTQTLWECAQATLTPCFWMLWSLKQVELLELCRLRHVTVFVYVLRIVALCDGKLIFRLVPIIFLLVASGGLLI